MDCFVSKYAPQLEYLRGVFEESWEEIPRARAELYGIIVVDGKTRRHLEPAKVVPHSVLPSGRLVKDCYYVVPGSQAASLIVKLDMSTSLWVKEAKDVMEQELRSVASDALHQALGIEHGRSSPDCLSDSGWLSSVVSCFKAVLYGRDFLEKLDAEPTFEITAFGNGKGLRARRGQRIEAVALHPAMCISLSTGWSLPTDICSGGARGDGRGVWGDSGTPLFPRSKNPSLRDPLFRGPNPSLRDPTRAGSDSSLRGPTGVNR
jgi:hypothetical protein